MGKLFAIFGRYDPLRVVAVVNFLVFVGIAQAIGGDALNGRARDGVYFLGMHGRWHQVSHATCLYSLVHEIVTFGLMLMALARGLDRREREQAGGDDSRLDS